MAGDVLGVNAPGNSSSVGDLADDPGVRRKALGTLEQMRKYITFVQMSIVTLEQALRSPGTLKTSHAAQAKKLLRDWVPSLVMEEGWIEAVLGAQYDWMAFRELAARAAARVGQKMEYEKAPKQPNNALKEPIRAPQGDRFQHGRVI